ncbi:MAG: CcmD family protein [Chloroflexota bacterium]
MLTFLLPLWAYLQTGEPGRFNEYLLLAYGVMWLVILVYIANLANKQRNLHQEIKLMRRLLEEDEREGNS